ncbi:MAG: hypothetical protein ACJ786_39730 [Catenulispora sp.]
MTETHTAQSSAAAAPTTTGERTGWVGWLVFAALMLIMAGSFQAIDGLVALFKNEVYLVRPDGLVVNVDYTTWGWVHLLLGILLITAGAAIFSGRVWGRTVGVVAAIVSAVLNFAYIQSYPVWSLLIIAVDIVVVYALIARGGELREPRHRY